MNSVKVVFLGTTGVGKTCIINRLTHDKFKPNTINTLGVMFVPKIISIPKSKLKVKFNIWDTAGQEKYKSLAFNYYRDADVVLLVYDVTLSYTFEQMKVWLKQVKDNVSKHVKLVLLGNKIDLIEGEMTTTLEAEEFAQENDMMFRFVSAKTGEGLSDLLEELGANFSLPKTSRKGLRSREHQIKLDKEKNSPSEGCC